MQDDFRNKAQRKMKGTAGQLRVSPDYMKSVIVPLPPLNEQKRIVSKIEELFLVIDSINLLLDSVKIQLKNFQTSLFNHVLNKNFTEEYRKKHHLEDWKTKTLSDLTLDSRNGFTGRPKDSPPGTPRLGITSITGTNSIYVEENFHKFIEIDESKLEKYLIQKNDLLVCRQNGNKNYVGKFAVFRGLIDPIIFSDSLIRFRVNVDEINPEYLVLFMNSKKARTMIEPFCSTTAGNYSINSTNLKTLMISLPSLEEQSLIISNIQSGLSYMQNLENVRDSLNSLIITMKNSILKQTFEGKLVPQDPNDELASELLKRIKLIN